MKVLVTGGAGYIGSTTCAALEAAGHTPVILDSLVTGARPFIEGRSFIEGDIADRPLVEEVFHEHPDIEAVIHMAARVVVAESTEDPGLYYRENVCKSLSFFETARDAGVRRVVFSSSASVYAPSPTYEVLETSPTAPASPYAASKLMMERMLADVCAASKMRGINLRYFNPVGSDPSLRSGVHVREPSHVLGQLVMASQGLTPAFKITGTQFDTRDGTGLRDYIHVRDLARAHVAAVERFDAVIEDADDVCPIINLGTGTGTTVRELLTAFTAAFGSEVPAVEADPRPGDVVGAYANVDKAAQLMGWRSELSVTQAIETALAWSATREQVLGYP